jgi:Ras-related protein Rab-8A
MYRGEHRDQYAGYYRQMMGVAFVYDITDEASFTNLPAWMSVVDDYAPKDVNKIIVGMKSDLEAERKVDTARAQQFADEHGLQLFEASAKNNVGIAEPFMQLAGDIKKRLIDSGALAPASKSVVKVNEDDKPTPKGGCA